MKKLMLIVLLLLTALLFILIGCKKARLTSEQTNNSAFKVELLFEHEGIKMYRFEDNGRSHYFTKSQTINTITVGKSSYQETIYSDTENKDSLSFN